MPANFYISASCRRFCQRRLQVLTNLLSALSFPLVSYTQAFSLKLSALSLFNIFINKNYIFFNNALDR
jgi:hypothetical protein